jgi:hypothetical protein
MAMISIEKAIADVAKAHGMSVADLKLRLEMEQAMKGPGGRDVMVDVLWDNVGRGTAFGPRPGQSRSVEQAVVRGTAWYEPAPLARPPGQDLIAAMCEADAFQQRIATPAGQRATLLALLAQAQKALETAEGDARAKLEATISQGEALLARLGGA